MARNQKPRWSSLVLIGLLSGGALIAEHYLSFSPAADTALLVVWVLLFYGAVGVWTSHNRASLERQPAPRDCVGRPIMPPDTTESPLSIMEPDDRGIQPAVRPLTRSEAA